jgi:hypothetical protein
MEDALAMMELAAEVTAGLSAPAGNDLWVRGHTKRCVQQVVLELANEFERKADATEDSLSTLGPEARAAVTAAMRMFSQRLRTEMGKLQNDQAHLPGPL